MENESAGFASKSRLSRAAWIGSIGVPCDLMEPVRPKVDAYVLNLLRTRRFRKADFFETREGICRITPPLTHELAGTGALWQKQLAPVTEHVAHLLFSGRSPAQKLATRRKRGILPTPLTKSNRSAGREAYRRKRKTASDGSDREDEAEREIHHSD